MLYVKPIRNLLVSLGLHPHIRRLSDHEQHRLMVRLGFKEGECYTVDSSGDFRVMTLAEAEERMDEREQGRAPRTVRLTHGEPSAVYRKRDGILNT